MNECRGRIFFKEVWPCVSSNQGRLIWLRGWERGKPEAGRSVRRPSGSPSAKSQGFEVSGSLGKVVDEGHSRRSRHSWKCVARGTHAAGGAGPGVLRGSQTSRLCPPLCPLPEPILGQATCPLGCREMEVVMVGEGPMSHWKGPGHILPL